MTNTKNILKKMLEIQKEIGSMKKDGWNDNNKYHFLSEKQVTTTMKDLLDKHGVVFNYNSEKLGDRLSPSGKQTIVSVKVIYNFIDVESGEMFSGYVVGEGSDSTDKAIFKAITGAIKYLYMKTFNIPTGDDPENDVRETKVVKKVDTSKPPFGKGSDEDEVID